MVEKSGYSSSVNLLDGQPTGVSGQAVLPGLQADVGCDAVKLKPKHEEFCWQYIAAAGNGMKAYKRVYPDVKDSTATVNASKLLTNANILARIDEILAERSKRHAVIADKVIDQHLRVLMLDHTEMLSNLRSGDLSSLSEDVRELLEVEQVAGKEGVRTVVNLPVKHGSRVELAKILGMTKENINLSGAVDMGIKGLLEAIDNTTKDLVSTP